MVCINEKLYEKFIANIKNDFKESRMRHTIGVRDLSVKMAEKFGADPEKAAVAAMFHDMCRGRSYTAAKINEYVREFRLQDKYLDNIALSHSKIASRLMQNEYGVTDKDILNAVEYHTTGRPEMSLLEKILFVADAAEISRSYAGVDKLRQLALKDIDKACIYCLKNTIEHLESEGVDYDPESKRTLEWFYEKEKKTDEKRRNGTSRSKNTQ